MYLLKTTHQRRDLEVQKFVKPRLKVRHQIFGPKYLNFTNYCSPESFGFKHIYTDEHLQIIVEVYYSFICQ